MARGVCDQQSVHKVIKAVKMLSERGKFVNHSMIDLRVSKSSLSDYQ